MLGHFQGQKKSKNQVSLNHRLLKTIVRTHVILHNHVIVFPMFKVNLLQPICTLWYSYLYSCAHFRSKENEE